MRKRDVLVIGSHVYGVYVSVDTLPRPGETILGHDFQPEVLDDGGKGSNQAMAAGRLGALTTFVGVVGAEPVAERAMERLREAGIFTAVRRSATAGTGVSMAIVDAQGMSMIVTDLGANRELGSFDLEAARFADHAVTLLQFEGPVDVTLDAARRAKRAGSRAIVTPGPYVPLPRGALGGVDIIAPNQTEAAALLGVEAIGDAGDAALAIHERWGVDNVVLTRGAEGCTLLWNGALLEVPAFDVEARNTIGAGDAFVGALAAGLAWSLSVEDAARLAAAAAAIAVAHPGAPWASYAGLGDVLTFLNSRGEATLAHRIAEHATINNREDQ